MAWVADNLFTVKTILEQSCLINYIFLISSVLDAVLKSQALIHCNCFSIRHDTR